METLKSGAVKAGSQLAAGFTILIALGMTLGSRADGAASVLMAVPLFLVIAYWVGRWRESRRTFSEYFSMTVVDKDVCEKCQAKFKGSELLVHQLQEHTSEDGKMI